VPPDVMMELEHNMLLAFTGRTRQGDHIIEDQTARFEKSESAAVEGLRIQKRLAVEMKDALLQRKVHDFGSLLGEAWTAKKQMSDRISSGHIDELYEAAMKSGALGGKVTGAGGGGYMLFYCRYDRKHRVADRLTELGAEITEFAFEPNGLRTWRADDR
jgi:D-glycero-alpha-D-manno-heptose-7-phosphate kinase